MPSQNSLSYVRFFRDYSIADLLFVLLSALTMSYLSFSPSSSILRNFICNELGRQPELLRDVADSGLNMENCEYWLERGVILMIAMYMVFVTVKVSRVRSLASFLPLIFPPHDPAALCYCAVKVLQPAAPREPRLPAMVHLHRGTINAAPAHLPAPHAHLARIHRAAPRAGHHREGCGRAV